jgi:hypothetical protein
MDLDKSRRVIGGDWCNELAPGGPYFTVSYQEGGVNLPEVETLVYLGSTRLDDEVEQSKTHFLFQLARSYQEDGDWSELPEDGRHRQPSAPCPVRVLPHVTKLDDCFGQFLVRVVCDCGAWPRD